MKKLLLTLFLVLVQVSCASRAIMATVVEQDAEDRYLGNGSATVFPYSFGILSSSDIKVLVNGVAQTLSTHYSLDGVGASGGGNVTFLTAPADAATVTILRNQPVSQLTNYVANSAYRPLTVMRDLDKVTMVNQMQEEKLRRAIKLPEISTLTEINFPLPAPLQYIRWNSAGTALETADSASAALASLTIATAGVWTNTQYNAPNQIIINGADFDALYSAEQPGKSTDGLTVAMKIPATSTVYQANTIAAYLQNLDTSTFGVAGYFSGAAGAANTFNWGLNSILSDNGFANVLLQNELDFNVDSATTTVLGLGLFGASTAQPTNATAIAIGSLDQPAAIGWIKGLEFRLGAIATGGAGIDFITGSTAAGAPAIQLGAIASGISQESQFIQLISTDSGGSFTFSTMRAAAGALLLRSGKNGQPVVLQDFNSGAGSNLLTANTTTIDLYPGATAKVRLEADGQLFLNSNTAIGNELVLGRQRFNGDDTILLQRQTDSGPTGNLLRMVNAANSTNLFQIDAAGTITRASNANTITATKTVRDAAGTGTCTLQFSGGVLVGGSC